MMAEQFDPMSEQPNDQRDGQDIVSADHPRDVTPGVMQAPQEMPPMNPPAETPGASVNQQDPEVAWAQQPLRNAADNAADMAASPTGSHLSPESASVETRDAGPGPDAAPSRTTGRQGPGHAQPIPTPTPTPLLSADVASAFLARWDAMQVAFVDEPHRVVEQADSLVTEVMQRITETMAQERTGLERQWAAGDAVSTEDLRLALQHYRSFFQRLLST
jgi:hypothetical protein